MKTKQIRTITALVCSLLIFLSCQKENIQSKNSELSNVKPSYQGELPGYTPLATPPTEICGQSMTIDLAKNGTDFGDITVSNDAENLFITVQGNSGLSFSELRFYVGSKTGLDALKNGGGNLGKNDLPIGYSNPSNPSTFSFALNTLTSSSESTCGTKTYWIVVYANTISDGDAWGDGESFTTNGQPKRFSYCEQVCQVDEGCSLSQGYWFNSGSNTHSWSGDITIGGKTYTEEEGRAIWNTSNAGGMPDTKKCFLQVAAIKLSGSSVHSGTSVWADVAICENWLSGLPKLAIDNLRDYSNADAVAAANRISDWITEHHCE